MASTKTKGDFAELRVAADLIGRGHQVAFPFGEDSDFDLLVIRNERIERVQVKYTQSDGEVVSVNCQSSSLTNGKVRSIKRYTARVIDWIAVFDVTTNRCYYVPAAELGEGRCEISLRLAPTKNNQKLGVRYADDYLDLEPPALQSMLTGP